MVTRPLPGAEHDTQAIDLYGPSVVRPGAAGTAVLFVHGGGWYAGDRSAYTGWAEHAAALGHPAGSVGYRTHPGSTYREKMVDVVTGWRLLAAEFPDAERVCLVGSSAGAHLVTALALSGLSDWADDADALPPPVAVVSMNGPGSIRPSSLLQSQERVDQLGLTTDEVELLDRPVTVPPLSWLFLNAENETYFPHEHVAAMASRLEAAGHRTATVLVPGTSHGFGYQVLTRDDEQARISAASVEQLWHAVS